MLPTPDNYATWQDFARALVRSLDQGGLQDAAVPVSGQLDPNRPATSITMPDGYQMLWLSQQDAELFLGNPQFDPPRAADLFTIDTKNIANAAIDVQKLRDGAVEFNKLFDGAVGTQKLADLTVTTAKIKDLAVSGAKILDATIGTAKIGDAAIVTALIGDAQIVNAKIADLAVNNAKIANLAVTGAKIANLSVGSAHILDAAIINAKIGNEISSYGWDGTNGWRITKDGSITGTKITILNSDGSVAFAAGKQVAVAGTNNIVNSSFQRDLFGWSIGNTGAQVSLLLNLPNYFGKRQVAYMHATAPMPAGSYSDVVPLGPWNGQSLATMRQYALPVKAGDTVGARVLAAAHRCNPALFILIFDKNGGLLEAPATNDGAIDGGAQDGDNMGTMQVIYKVGAPTAAYAQWMLRMNPRAGDEYLFFAEPWMGKLLDKQEVLPPYTAGPADPLATLGATLGVNAFGFGTLAGKSSVDVSETTGFGQLAKQSAVDLSSQIYNSLAKANVSGLGTLAGQNTVDLASQVYGLLSLASTTGSLDRSRTTGFGSLSAIDMLTTGNISTYIQAAAIGRALIGNAAIGTANIDNAAITSALIQDLAVLNAKIADLAVGNSKIGDASITNAKIADAQITSAKIGNLQVTNAHIENLTVGTGKIADKAVRDSTIWRAGDATFTNNGARTVISMNFPISSASSDVVVFLSGLLSISAGAAAGTYAVINVAMNGNTLVSNFRTGSRAVQQQPLFIMEATSGYQGTVNFVVTIQASASNGTGDPHLFERPLLLIQEYKK